MNLQEIKKIMELFDNSNIAKFQLKQEGIELKLQKATACKVVQSLPQVTTQTIPQAPVATESSVPSAPQSASKESSGVFVTSPMVGTFYRSPSPGAAPYVNVGDIVKKGQTVGIIEAMKIMNEIEADFDCKIVALEVNDGQPVEYGANLIKVEKL